MKNIQYQKLGTLVDLQTSKHSITKKQHIEDGKYNVISSAAKPSGKYDQFNEDGHQITISKDGTCGVILWHQDPFWLADGAYVVKIKPNVDLDARYLYHYLKRCQSMINAMQVGQPIAHLYKSHLEQLDVAVVDLKKQQAIAATLDKFNELTNELTNELNLRQKQYQYYLKTLFDFANPEHPFVKNGGGVISKTLEQIAIIKLGTNIDKMKQLLDMNQLPLGKYLLITSAMQPISTYNKANFSGQKITISTRGNPGFVMWQTDPFWATSLAAVVSVKDQNQVSPKYLYYALKNQESTLQMQKEGGGVKALYFNHFKAIKVDLPDLKIQKQIVNALDQLSTLCNDLSTGLPAQIANANKQYQYYLKQLLTF